MQMIEQACQHCGTVFKPLNSSQKFCGDACKSAAYRKRKSLGQVTSTSVAKRGELVSPETLPVSAKFIVDELTRQRDKLETLCDKQADEIKGLIAKNTELEKDRDRANHELSQKPSLGGLLSTPENIKTAGETLKDIIAGGIEMVRAVRENNQAQQQQLGQGQQQPQIHANELAIVNWFRTQPKEVAQGVLDVMNGLNSNPAKAMEFVAFFKRTMMGAGVKVGNG